MPVMSVPVLEPLLPPDRDPEGAPTTDGALGPGRARVHGSKVQARGLRSVRLRLQGRHPPTVPAFLFFYLSPS